MAVDDGLAPLQIGTRVKRRIDLMSGAEASNWRHGVVVRVYQPRPRLSGPQPEYLLYAVRWDGHADITEGYMRGGLVGETP